MSDAIPSSEESEMALLSSWLNDPVIVPGLCAVAGVDETWFHAPQLRSLALALGRLWKAGTTPDRATIAETMRQTQEWPAGGHHFLSEVINYVPTSTHTAAYIDDLRRCAMLRDALAACRSGIEVLSVARGDESDQAVADLTRKITEATRIGALGGTPSFAKLLRDKVNRVENADMDANLLTTGIRKLDEYSPMQRGDMPLIVGERKSGKSILSIAIALHVASTHGPVLYFSLEERAPKVIDRIVANASRVGVSKQRHPMTEGHMIQFQAAISRLLNLNFILRDDIHDLAAMIGVARQVKAQHSDLSLIVADYAQLIRGGRQKGDTRESEVANVSRSLRLLAMETNVAVLLLAQLNKDGDSRESKALEMDATAAWKIALIDQEPLQRRIAIPWQRNGESGVGFRVAFFGDESRIDTSHENYDENPSNGSGRAGGDTHRPRARQYSTGGNGSFL